MLFYGDVLTMNPLLLISLPKVLKMFILCWKPLRLECGLKSVPKSKIHSFRSNSIMKCERVLQVLSSITRRGSCVSMGCKPVLVAAVVLRLLQRML